MEEEKDDAYEANAFDALEKDFQEVLHELVGDKSLEQFRLEYEKLHRALKKSHESEKRLIKKCRELNAEIVMNASKVQTALKLSQEDQTTIQSLKKEIERAWKMVESSHEKEQRAKDTVHTLKVEIASLSKLVEQGAGLSINQENTVNNLVQAKNDLLKHRDMLTGQVQQLTSQHQSLSEKVERVAQERQKDEQELEVLKEALLQRKVDGEKELRKKEKLDKDLKESRVLVDARAEEIQAKSQEMAEKQSRLTKVHSELLGKRKEQERLVVRLDSAKAEIEQVTKMTQDEVAARKKYKKEHDDTKLMIQGLDDELKHINKEKAKIAKNADTLKKEKEQADAERSSAEGQRVELRNMITALQKKIEKLKRQEEADNKLVVDLLHERDILNKGVVRADDRCKDQHDLVKRHESQANNLQREVSTWKSALGETLKRVHELEKQSQKYQQELSVASGKYIHTLEELKLRDSKLADLKKAIGEVSRNLAQQKNLYEAVRTDRNLYSKNLLESNDEIAEMVRKFRSMSHQIEALKEEIKEKDQSLIKEHFEKNKVNKAVEAIGDALNKANERQAKLQELTDKQRGEVKKLEQAIQEAEQEQQNQRKEFEQVTSERNILSTQLNCRNEELQLLYEKVKIQQSTLEKGETQYRERLEEIRVLKTKEVGSLQRQLSKTQQQAGSLGDLGKEVYHLERELLHEKAKVKALSEELENPMNVHRWRKLEGSEPPTFELLQKVRTLQARLIDKSEEVAKKDRLLVDKEKAYLALKAVLARQPGPEVTEQVKLYVQNLEQKNRQMKAMGGEVKTYQTDVSDYKDEAQRLTRELQVVKRKFFEQKKREQSQRGPAETPKVQLQTNLQLPRYTGGGFCLTAS